MAVSETETPGRAVIPEIRSFRDSGGACDQVTLTRSKEQVTWEAQAVATRSPTMPLAKAVEDGKR